MTRRSSGSGSQQKRSVRLLVAIQSVMLLLLATSPCLASDGVGGPQARDGVWTLGAPSGEVSITVSLIGGSLHYSVWRGGTLVIEDSDLGMERADADFASALTFVSASTPTLIDEIYAAPHGKRSELRNHGYEQTLEFSTPSDNRLQLIIRAYDDGVAFRYRFPETSWNIHTVTNEWTTFTIAANGRAVMQPYLPESLHDIFPTEDPPHDVGGWAIPALFDLGHSWVMIAESDVDKSFYAAQLDFGQAPREYRIRIPTNHYGTREPTWTMPWEMPWRAIVIGETVGRVVESDLVSHLADPSRITDTSWIEPGRVSWHWWTGAWVGSMTILEDYVDLAETMGWEYSLVDADWDDFHSDAEMQYLVDYAAARDVGIFLWYNSAGPQNNYTFSPRDRMWEPEIRREEMDKLVTWGVKGIKVDFFNSEKQVMIQHYLGILEDAAARGLMVSFHGSTPPRGWYRTWPNMMTTEAVRGAEYYRIDPNFPDDAPHHNVELVFTRNVVGPMDYTPVTFSDKEYPHITTNAHELALSVVFESGLLHMADSYSSYLAQPAEVLDFLGDVPAAWDETRFLEGDPASHVVLARRNRAIWYVAGINGTGGPLEIDVELTQFDYPGSGGTCISDGESPRTFSFATVVGSHLGVTLAPYGGFVATLPSATADAASPPTGDFANGLDGHICAIELIRPNPFIRSTTIDYRIQKDATTLIRILGPTGRLVRTLVNATHTVGDHSISWDGTDDAGAEAPAGIYFCQLKIGRGVSTTRLLRLR